MTVLDVLRYSPLPDIFDQREIGQLPAHILEPWIIKCAGSVKIPPKFRQNSTNVANYVIELAQLHASNLLLGRLVRDEDYIVSLIKIRFTAFLKDTLAELS